MRRDRGYEEISLCKKEISNFLRFLGQKRITLEGKVEHLDGGSTYQLGCALLAGTEIGRLTKKIQETLTELELCSVEDFRLFFSNEDLGKYEIVDCSDSDADSF